MMMLIAAEGVPVVQNVIDHYSQQVTGYRCRYRVYVQAFHTNNQYRVSGDCCSRPDQGESQKLVFQLIYTQCCMKPMYQGPCKEVRSNGIFAHQELSNPDIQGRGRPTGRQNTVAECDVAVVTE